MLFVFWFRLQCIIVWDVRSGQLLRGFDKGLSTSWPAFRWSHDDKYLARITSSEESKGGEAKESSLQISVYETPLMNLLEKKSIKIEAVREVQWSPSANILSYTVPERGDVPAKVRACLSVYLHAY